MTNEQRELVERLRNSSNSMRHDAADLIEQFAERCGRLEAALRCCLADPRIPTDLWRVIEPALATAETISNPRKEDDDDTDPMVPRPAG